MKRSDSGAPARYPSLARSGIDAEGVANGKTVMRSSGTEVTATLESGSRADGSFEIGGRIVPLTALGTASDDSAVMALDVWIVIEASGTTESGEPAPPAEGWPAPARIQIHP